MPVMCAACICAHTTCDFEDCTFLCIQSQECLCIKGAGCLSPGADSRGCGCVTEDDEICKIGCFCCDCGLQAPKTCTTSASQCLCMQRVVAIPFHEDYVDECVCAVCGLQCAPECGCCKEPPTCKALKLMKDGVPGSAKTPMQRD